MNKTILALLFVCASLTNAAAVEPSGGTSFNTPATRASAALNFAASSLPSWLRKTTAILDPRRVEETCLATAIYFEARSEPLQGQMAVAMVILNRTRAEHYPATICGVVYQGASRFNRCQFSYACDGKTDLPEPGKAWDMARAVTTEALAGGAEHSHEELQVVTTALNYHADYVKPRWSRSLTRLTKIGRHIFYSQG